MRLLVCGARGSTPAVGAEFLRYGGHTSCLALAHPGQPPELVLDAGTGLARMSRSLDGQPFSGSILLTHLHWDHTHGLPFFPAGDRPDATVDLYLPAQGDPEQVLRRAMSPPHFPITPAQLRGRWTFRALEEGASDIAGFSILAREIPHKGGRTYGYRISTPTASLAYLPDHDPLVLGPGPAGHGAEHDAARQLADRVDLLIHDAQFSAAEVAAHGSFGHSAAEYAAGLAVTARARRLLLFHHSPKRSDDELDALAAAYAGWPVPVEVAAEGMVIDLPCP